MFYRMLAIHIQNHPIVLALEALVRRTSVLQVMSTNEGSFVFIIHPT